MTKQAGLDLERIDTLSDWIKKEIIAGTNFLPISNTDHSYTMQLRPFSGRLAHVHRIAPSWKKSTVLSGFLQWECLRREIGLLSSLPLIEKVYDKNAVRARRLSICIF